MSPYWLAGLAVVVLLGVLSRRAERSTGSRRPRSDQPPPTPEDIDALLRVGEKIEAIKLYRVMHGVDLKAAKEAIEARARQLGR